MTGCARCGTVLAGRFCQACGFDSQAPVYACPRCGAGFTGYTCPFCGLPLGASPYVAAPAGTGLRAVGSVVWSMALVVFLLLLVVEFVALIYTANLVISGSASAGPRYISLYVLLPFPTGENYDASPDVFLAYYALLLVAILAAYGYYAVKDGRLTGQTFARPLVDLGARLGSRSAFLATGQVFLALFFFQGLYLFVLWLSGFEPAVPTFPGSAPPWYDYFALANASVYEEIVTRWLYIGLPLFVGAVLLSFVSRPEANRASLGKASAVPAWRHLVGGTITRDSPRALIVLAAILLVVSSAVFGLAHVPSWGWWKFLPTFVAGLGLGYLFLRHGLLAAILLHFATNYLAALALLAESNLGGQVLIGFLILVMIGLGILFFAWYIEYAVILIQHFASAWRGKPSASAVPASAPSAPSPPPAFAPAPPPPIPYAYGTAPVAFECPRCRWREARYADGRFTCLRCGQVT